MRILIDIGHPAHVHYFKHFARIMQDKGHKVFFTTIEKEFEPYLLKASGFNFKKLGKHRKTIPGKVMGLLRYNLRLWGYCMKIKPDIYLGAGSISASHVAFLMHKPFIQFEDTGNMEQIRLYLPFSRVVFTPENLAADLGKKQVRYKGYQEIMYLHPAYFTPDPAIYNFLGIAPGTPYCIIRFVSWQATHDVGIKRMNLEEKAGIIEHISKKMRVFVSSEGNIPADFEKYRIKIPPEKMHDALAFADLFVGEGATMASEAGLLGTPSIYINPIPACNNIDQEKYETVFNFDSANGVIEKIDEILDTPNYKKLWKERSTRLLESKIDVTAMLIEYVEKMVR
jgi:predicted glycosyltransferase